MFGLSKTSKLGLAFLIVSALLIAGRDTAAAQTSTQTLTIAVAVCPEGDEGDDLAVDCEDRLARDYSVDIVESTSSTLIADDVNPDENGFAVADLTDVTPTSLQVTINTAVNVGTRTVSCIANGDALDADLGGDGAGIPVFFVDAATTENIDCTVYLFGFTNDADLLDIVEPATDTDDSEDVVGLPNTGIGATPGEASRQACCWSDCSWRPVER